MNSTFVWQSECDTVASIEDNDSPFKNENAISRGNLLLGIFQKNTSQETLDFAKEMENDPSGSQRKIQHFPSKVDTTSKVFQYGKSRKKNHESMTEEGLAKEINLIRIFPGPAGLVPDKVKNDNVSATSYLSSVEKLEKSKMAIRHIEIKSQDEKNLFGEKAWKFLLNDLPKNFLQDCEISTVKDKANASHCDSTKVRFIAGVLDYVDHSHDDPFVILKDSTGSIEGTIHRDIPLTYPGVLEPNVVILLRDVGLLKTTTYLVTNKYHILVSLVNLLAIYSDKGRIVSTSFMESILSHTSNIELNRINDCTSVSKSVYISGLQMDESHNTSWQAGVSIETSNSRIKARESELANDPLLHLTSEKYESYGEAFKNDKNCKVTDGCFNDSMDGFFTADFTTLGQQDRSICKSTSISPSSKIKQCDLQMENIKHFEKESIHFQKQLKEPQTLQKCITDVKTCSTHYSHENCLSPYDDVAYRDSNGSMRSTLPEIKRNIKNSKALVSYFTNDKKCDEYDSDDEILSQLDVDNVFNEPKKDR